MVAGSLDYLPKQRNWSGWNLFCIIADAEKTKVKRDSDAYNYRSLYVN